MLAILGSFLTKMKDRLRSIARATRNETTVEELIGDAWIAAHELGKKQGREIDFDNPDDQDLLVRTLHVRNVKRTEKHMHFASRIDETGDDGKGEIGAWINQLPAAEASDPLVSLLLDESAINPDALLAASYSQAAAYVMVFVRFKNNREEVCTYLVISNGTLSRRVTHAADTVRVQPSLFDRVETIRDDFKPLQGRRYAVRAEQHYQATQLGWVF